MHLFLLLLSTSLAAEPAIAPGVELVYRGSVAQLGPDRAPLEAEKSFELYLFCDAADAAGSSWYWAVYEQGRGSWPWSERFGRWQLDSEAARAEGPSPSLLYNHGDGRSVIPLPPPLLVPPVALSEGAAWESDELAFEVGASERLADREAWPVRVRNAYGHKRTVWLDKDAGLVQAVDERVFMGMGTEYLLRVRLAASTSLEPSEQEAVRAGFKSLLALRGKLSRPPLSDEERWSEADQRLLDAELPALQQKLSKGPLARMVQSAARDLELAASRKARLEDLAAEYQGRAVEAFEAAGLNGARLARDDLQGRVTLLHFWEYRDTPLEEPYGQVGYLEFLYSRRKEAGLKLYGVAVDSRLADEAGRSQAVAGVRKLKAFMNLSYPILLDGGELLAKFGDPRVVGGALPLFVLVGPEGKILHHHVGYYDVDPQQGLKELQSLIDQALRESGKK